MTTISFSPVKNLKNQRAIRYVFILSHSAKERERLWRCYRHAGFRDCWVREAKSRAKNGAYCTVWKIPAAPVAISLFKKALEVAETRYKSRSIYRLCDFINWLIANNQTANRKEKIAKKSNRIVIPEEDKRAVELLGKLKKSVYSEKIAAYKEKILDSWVNEGRISSLELKTGKGIMNGEKLTGRELAGKAKKKSLATLD